MKSFTTYIALAAVLVARASFAAQPPDIKELEHSTKVFIECAKIADEIAAMKVPEGHAMERAIKASHDHPESKGHKEKIAPEHDKFMTEMEGRVHRLDECGKKYEVAVKESEERLEKLATENITEEQGNAITPIIKNYHAAKDTMVDSIAALSKDIQVQSYVHKVLLEHFLKDHKKKA